MHVRFSRSADYTLSGTVPLTICEFNSKTSYRLTVDGPGIESRIGTFSLDRAGTPSVSGLRTMSTLRNAVVPGWGTAFAGHPVTGWTDGLSLAVVLYAFVKENQEYHHLRNRYDVGMESLARAETLAEKLRIQDGVRLAARDVNVQNKHRRRLAVLTAALYGYQLMDRWIAGAPPGMRTDAGGSVVKLNTARSSTVKAFLYSLVYPGRGQFYQGKKVRGALFSTLTLASGIAAIDYHNAYDDKANRYGLAVERFYEAPTVEERATLKLEAERVWDEVRTARRERNAAYIVVAGLWGLNLIDTFLGSEYKQSDSHVSVEVGPTGGVFIVRF